MTRHDKVLSQIREYHKKLHPDQQDMTPLTADLPLVKFRSMLFNEESNEAIDEFSELEMLLTTASDNLRIEMFAKLVHELADTVIVAYGTAMRLSIDLDEVMRLVMNSSLKKERNPDPKGKALKGPKWQSADRAITELVWSVDDNK